VPQRPRATQAHIGKQVDEGVDAVNRQQLAVGAAMALLAATLALRLALVACRSCCLARARARPIARRRRCEFFEFRFSSPVNTSTCLVSASTFAVNSACARSARHCSRSARRSSRHAWMCDS
jgi:hypothetical protein